MVVWVWTRAGFSNLKKNFGPAIKNFEQEWNRKLRLRTPLLGGRSFWRRPKCSGAMFSHEERFISEPVTSVSRRSLVFFSKKQFTIRLLSKQWNARFERCDAFCVKNWIYGRRFVTGQEARLDCHGSRSTPHWLSWVKKHAHWLSRVKKHATLIVTGQEARHIDCHESRNTPHWVSRVKKHATLIVTGHEAHHIECHGSRSTPHW